MFQVLKQTAFKSFLLLLIANFAFAKEVPITNVITVYIPVKEFAVVEFPFKIKDKKPSPFFSQVREVVKKNKSNDSESLLIPKMEKPTFVKKKNGKIDKNNNGNSNKKAPIKISGGKNYIQFYPLSPGNMELVVWGYKKYPILLKIIAHKTLGEKYYRFVDYSNNTADTFSFESDPHKKIISKLTKALFLQKVPKGFKAETYYSKFTDGNLSFVLVQSFVGKKYLAQEWRATASQPVELYPEAFFNDEIFSVCFENDVLDKNETTRVFIVRKFALTNSDLE